MPLTIAGRNLRQAEAFARHLGRDCFAVNADLTRQDTCRAALQGHSVAVNCAGPFQRQDAGLLEACLQVGCHYADIADDRRYAALVRSFTERFARQNLGAVYGCSSLPGISGALALRAWEGATAGVDRVRVTLFVGNNNPKGHAALQSFLASLGKPISAPQGIVFGFHDREVVRLPPPFGPRGVFNFESPEYDLFSPLLGARAISVKVGFELRLATYTLALLAHLGSNYGPALGRLLKLPAHALGFLGCSGGAVMAELFLTDGSVSWAALVGHRDGQRMAALPCALVARALVEGNPEIGGVATAFEFLGARSLLEKLVQAGFALHTE
jgi:hypothetical protein